MFFLVKTANVAHYQTFLVRAHDVESAARVADLEANDDEVLSSEAGAARDIGQESPGRYRVLSVTQADMAPRSGAVQLIASGSNG